MALKTDCRQGVVCLLLLTGECRLTCFQVCTLVFCSDDAGSGLFKTSPFLTTYFLLNKVVLEDCRRAELYTCNHLRTEYHKLMLLNLMFNMDMWQEVIVGTYYHQDFMSQKPGPKSVIFHSTDLAISVCAQGVTVCYCTIQSALNPPVEKEEVQWRGRCGRTEHLVVAQNSWKWLLQITLHLVCCDQWTGVTTVILHFFCVVSIAVGRYQSVSIKA